MGRRAKPVELHLVGGRNKNNLTKETIHKRKEGEARVRPPSDNITPPEWLDDAATAVWQRIVTDLAETDILTNADVHELAILCNAIARHAEAEKMVQEEGPVIAGTKGVPMQNPAVLVANKYYATVAKLAPRFGLDPSGRASLAIPRKQERQEDPFEKQFGAKKA